MAADLKVQFLSRAEFISHCKVLELQLKYLKEQLSKPAQPNAPTKEALGGLYDALDKKGAKAIYDEKANEIRFLGIRLK